MTRDKKDISGSPIAIVGMSCRFPGGVTTPDEYWRLLVDQIDAITEVPPERWNKDVLFSEDRQKAGKTYSRWGGFLDTVDRFDPLFFRLSPREADLIDPQQRLFLEVASEALEDAAHAGPGLARFTTGVFVGASPGEYRELLADLLGDLTDRQRAMARLMLVDGLRQSEVAERLEVSRATISVMAERARIRRIEGLLHAVRRIVADGIAAVAEASRS